MTMAKKLPLLAPSIHTFEVNGTYTDCEAKRTVFMAIQKMVSAYPDFGKRYITLSGVNLARPISMCALMHKGTKALSEQKMIRAKQNENSPESQEWS